MLSAAHDILSENFHDNEEVSWTIFKFYVLFWFVSVGAK
jgi:hypothetical protein